MFTSTTKTYVPPPTVSPELYSDIYTIVGGWLITEKELSKVVESSTAIPHQNLTYFLNLTFKHYLLDSIQKELSEFINSKEDASRIQRLITVDVTIRQRHGNTLIDRFVDETLHAIAKANQIDVNHLALVFEKYPWIYLFAVAQYVDYMQKIQSLNKLKS